MIDAARRPTNQHRTMKSILSTIALGLSALISPVSAESKAGAKGIAKAAVVPQRALQPKGAPEPGKAIRLVGDAGVKPKLADGQYQLAEAGVGIETPLPEGYPAPTPPEMIELKTYPAVRRAELSGKGASDMGMIKSFFPLFNHIKKQEIEMTSPVEMEYRRGGDDKPLTKVPLTDGDWTVSFLYRKSDMGQAGKDGQVKVVDVPEIVVVSIGMKGAYGSGVVQQGLEALQQWFAGQDAWEPTGDPRSLMYNGPGAPFEHQWMEVQVPVRQKAQAGAAKP